MTAGVPCKAGDTPPKPQMPRPRGHRLRCPGPRQEPPILAGGYVRRPAVLAHRRPDCPPPTCPGESGPPASRHLAREPPTQCDYVIQRSSPFVEMQQLVIRDSNKREGARCQILCLHRLGQRCPGSLCWTVSSNQLAGVMMHARHTRPDLDRPASLAAPAIRESTAERQNARRSRCGPTSRR